jgi:signal transduction histidine kinase
MNLTIATDRIGSDRDVVTTRLRALRLSQKLGLDPIDQTRIATAVSEIARNALIHAGGGVVTFSSGEIDGQPALLVEIADKGKGIRQSDNALFGNGSKRGLASARRLVDHFDIRSGDPGTVIQMGKTLPAAHAPVTTAFANALKGEEERMESADPIQALNRQNAELLAALAEGRARQEELVRVNQELDDTNRGVMALHAELEDRAEHLRQASDLKTRFLSNMSHEFRTPLSSILALTRLLLDRADGDLKSEQIKQVNFVRQSAQDLLDLINDLLDLAKVEAGKLNARPSTFSVSDLFGGLRGVLKPLQPQSGVVLSIEDPEDVPMLNTDQGRLAQILRNFVSNALRFTKRGSIDVRAKYHQDRDFFEFVVTDTGIGIAEADQAGIFQEFSQVDNPLQHESAGTGLGLPLSQRLAELLGGYIMLDSEVGAGSTFSLWIPRNLDGEIEPSTQIPGRKRLLIVDDEETFRYIVREMVSDLKGLDVMEARSGLEGLAKARHARPDIIILDVLMPGLSGQEALRAFQQEPGMEDVPVFIITSLPLTDRLRNEFGKAAGILGKQHLAAGTLKELFAPHIDLASIR